MEDTAVSADGVPIHYEVHGEGVPALVFVHGWSCDRGYWEKQVSHFAQKSKVVTIDLAGHGESGLDRKFWTMDAFGWDVVAVVEQLGLEQVVLIGHSMGGTVIVEAAQRMPQNVIALIAVETFRNLARPLTRKEIAELLAPFRTDFAEAVGDFVRTNQFVSTSDPVLVETIVKDMAFAPPDVAVPVAEYLHGHTTKVRDALQKMDMPVVLINSDHRPTNISATERCGIKVETMSGVSHFLMIEAPTQFNRRLEETVKELVVQGASSE